MASEPEEYKKIRGQYSIFNPCCCDCGSWNLRVCCIINAVFQTVMYTGFFAYLMVVIPGGTGAFTKGTTIQKVLSWSGMGLLILTAVAGVVLMLAVCTRSRALCLLHTSLGVVATIAETGQVFLVILEFNKRKSKEPLIVLMSYGIFNIFIFVYFAMCSYGLQTLIRVGIDRMVPIPYKQTLPPADANNNQKQQQPAPAPPPQSPSQQALPPPQQAQTQQYQQPQQQQQLAQQQQLPPPSQQTSQIQIQQQPLPSAPPPPPPPPQIQQQQPQIQYVQQQPPPQQVYQQAPQPVQVVQAAPPPTVIVQQQPQYAYAPAYSPYYSGYAAPTYSPYYYSAYGGYGGQTYGAGNSGLVGGILMHNATAHYW